MISLTDLTTPTIYLAGAFVTLGLLLLILRWIFDRGGIKHIPGPPSPSLLLGMSHAAADYPVFWG